MLMAEPSTYDMFTFWVYFSKYLDFKIQKSKLVISLWLSYRHMIDDGSTVQSVILFSFEGGMAWVS